MNFTEAVELAKKKEEAGYKFLYEQTFKKGYYLVRKYVNDEDLTNDVLQDAYVRAFSCIEDISNPDNFPSWFYTIATRTAINELKRKKPVLFSQMREDESDVDFEDTLEDDRVDGSPELSLDAEETKRLVKEILDTLSDEQCICILMFYMEEKSIREIAELIGVSENTVKSRLNYGRKAVKEKVLELEKKGTKLYGILPFGFFLYLLKMDASACEVSMVSSSASLYQSISNKMSLRTNASAYHVPQNVALGGVKVAKAITTKIIVGTVLGVVVCGTVMFGMVKILRNAPDNTSVTGIVSEKNEQDATFKVPLTDEQMESDYPVIKTEKETPSPKPTPTPEKEDMPADGYRFEYGCLYEGFLMDVVEDSDSDYFKATWQSIRKGTPVSIPREEVLEYQIGSTRVFEGETFWCSEEDEMYWYFIPEYEDSLESTNMDGDISFQITKSEFCEKDSTCFMRFAAASGDYGRYYLWEDVGDVVSYLTGEEELIYDRVDGWIYKSGSLKDIYEDESIIGECHLEDTWRGFYLMMIYAGNPNYREPMVTKIEEQSLCG